MIFTPTKCRDLYVIRREPRDDNRGWFARTFAKEELKKAGIEFNLVHINQAFTKEKGTLRGMHRQVAPKEEAKIFQCLKGKIFDVSIDMREGSPTYHKWFGIELSEDNHTMTYIPKGFAHGYQTLTEDCLVQYFVDEYYEPEAEKGVMWNDPAFNIDWPIKTPILSPKDQKWGLVK
jgi:dTDP-4-dehydrorhamnose 3,5-epimerase